MKVSESVCVLKYKKIFFVHHINCYKINAIDEKLTYDTEDADKPHFPLSCTCRGWVAELSHISAV